jgi:hypothetical protein
LFNYLKQHPEITTTIRKEPFSDNLTFFTRSHIEFYKTHMFNELTSETKVLLDGSNSLPEHIVYEILDDFKEWLEVKDIRMIYLFRDPYEILKSLISFSIVWPKYRKQIKQILSGENRLLSETYITMIRKKLSIEKIFFLCIEDLPQREFELMDFIGVSRMKLNLNICRNDESQFFFDHRKSPKIIEYLKFCNEITRDNEKFSWIYDDYKYVDDNYGTNLVEYYNLSK